MLSATTSHLSYILTVVRIAEINNAVISMQINNIYEPYRQNKKAESLPLVPDFFGNLRIL